jgi:hypothetical protein
MKQFFILLPILLCATLTVSAQDLTRELSRPGQKGKDNSNEMDSLGYNQVESVIKVWKLTNDFSTKKIVNLDTVLGEHQNYNPIFKRSISNSYLGNLGSAYQSNIFMDRDENETFLFFKLYRAYIVKPEDIIYFNTTTPYTRLFYETGGPKGRSENLLRALHTQNISPNLNFGVSYNLISSDGQYQNQKTKLYDFTFFTSYRKMRYGLDFVMNSNRINNEENGGLFEDDSLEEDEDSQNLQVNLSGVQSKLTNFNFMMNHTYGIGEEKEIINNQDSTYADTSYVYSVEVKYNFHAESNSWQFKENTINREFYNQDALYNQNSTFDKVENTNIKNSFQLVFNENENKWIRLGARFGILNEFKKYNLRRPISGNTSLKQTDENIHNTQLLASLFSESGKSINWTAIGKYTFEGYRQNDFDLSYKMTKWIGEKENGHGFSVKGQLKSTTPNFIIEEYYGNHQKWENNFDKITELKAGIEYFNKKRQLKVGGQFRQIENFIYFGSDALPNQTSKSLRVVSGYLEKNFKLGKFHLNQKLVGQNSSDDFFLSLPTFSVYSNNYYQNTFFDGALGLQTGIAVHYNTAFYAPKYMPATGQFYNQKEKKIGDYPKVDIYFNFRIKRTRFFFMYEHANASFGSKDYFSSLHYPINPAMFKYGLIWTFYN